MQKSKVLKVTVSGSRAKSRALTASSDAKRSKDMSSESIKVETPKNLYGTYTSEFSGLTPDDLKFYFETSRKGLNFFISLLFDEIRRRDMRIGAVCQTRKLGVANKEWGLSYKAESVVTEATQKEIISFIYNALEGVNLPNFFTDIVEAQIQGVSTFEVVYKMLGAKVGVDKINYIPNYLLLYDDLTNSYSYLDPDKADAVGLRSIGSTSDDRIKIAPLATAPIHPMKILEAHSLDGNAQNGFLNGCHVSLVWAFLFKNYGLKDWSVYVERYAMPAVLGKLPQFISKPDREKFVTAVKQFGHLFRGVIPNGATIEFLTDQSKSSSSTMFQEYVEYWNKEISIRVLGQSLTTDIGSVGSKAASQTHDEVRHDIAVADMLLVKQVMNELIRRLVVMNFGEVSEFPKFSFEEEEDIEYKLKRSQIFVNLRNAGWKVSQENIEKEFGVTVEPLNLETNSQAAFPNEADNFIKQFTGRI